MANMSYCRFQNTLEDLRDCYESLGGSNNPLDELSEREKNAAIKLIKLAKKIADDYGDDVGDS